MTKVVLDEEHALACWLSAPLHTAVAPPGEQDHVVAWAEELGEAVPVDCRVRRDGARHDREASLRGR